MNSSTRSLKKQMRSFEERVRQILLAWNPIGNGFPVPADEYDCLVHKILSSWFQQHSKEQLRELIARELTDHFEIPDALPGVDAVVEQVFALPAVVRPEDAKQDPNRQQIADHSDKTPGRG